MSGLPIGCTTYTTGAQREDKSNKPAFRLIPINIILRLAKHYGKGAVVHGERNWQKGLPLSSFYDSAMRHLTSAMRGEDNEDHAIAAVWNVMGFAWTLDQIEAGFLPEELDDRSACC